MPSQATITAPLGPGLSVTAMVFNEVTEFLVLPYPRSVIIIKHNKGYSEFAIGATTTFTVTPSGGNLTVTISQ